MALPRIQLKELEKVNDLFSGKKVLIIGGTGTVGTSLFYSLLRQSPQVIRLFSRDEHKQSLLMKN